MSTMTHRRAGNAQIGLSYFFLTGFFVVLILEGLGYIKSNVSNNLREVLMLVMSFWFMRQRTSGDEPTTSAPEKPSDPKAPSPP
jgi:hypothetical protein